MNKLFDKLAATSSRLEKESILTGNKNNKTLRLVCFLALDPFTNFYIRKIPKYSTSSSPHITLDQALDKLLALSTRQKTGNAGIEYLTEILESLNPDDAKVIERVIEKDLRCGVSEATVNKIWPDLVPTYPCMLASAYEEKLINKMEWPASVQVKLDGMRFNAIVQNGTVEFRSRNGKELNLLGHLESQFLTLAGNDQVVFDGELCVVDDNGKFMPRQKGNGILSKAQKGTLSQQEAARIHATVWDFIPYQDFTKGLSTMKYSLRLKALVDTLNHKGSSITRVTAVQHYNVGDINQARDIFDDLLSRGEEGIILKNLNSPWEDKRAKHQIKFKGELECDLVVVDWVEGTGKNTGRLGALVLQSSDGVVNVSVGTGFTDEHRDTIDRSVIGRVVAIKYNSRIQDNKTGIESLFLPVFVEIRDDKTQADSSKEIA